MVTLSLHISPDIVGPIKAYLHGIPFWLWFEHFEPEGEMLWMRRALEMEQDVALERGRLTWLCIPAILIYSMNFQNSSKFINHTDLFSCLSVLRIDPARLASKSTRTHIDNTARDARCLSQMSQTSQTSQTKSQKKQIISKNVILMIYWLYIDDIDTYSTSSPGALFWWLHDDGDGGSGSAIRSFRSANTHVTNCAIFHINSH